MPTYVAFLRAINVGGHLVKMEHLRELFIALKFTKVETFIASGNVIFDSPSKSAGALEKKIEAHLLKDLGYEVRTFVRSISDLAKLVASKPFNDKKLNGDDTTLYVGFLTDSPGEEVKQKLYGYRNEVNTFLVSDREVFWWLRTKFSETDFSGAKLEKVLGMKTTIRNANTAKRIAAKYSSHG
jgi:uncharacterized protein (DUF1697 family)